MLYLAASLFMNDTQLSSPTGNVSETLISSTHMEKELDIDQCLGQIERIVRSSIFIGSESLCRLLEYLSHHTLSSPAEHLKEYQIGTEALGRPADFDPQSESTVRVQVRRLREKLAEYYDSAGIQDCILVEIPKGRYVLSFTSRSVSELEITPPPARREGQSEPAQESPTSTTPERTPRPILVAFAVGALLLGMVALYYFHRNSTKSAITQTEIGPVPKSLQAFWSPFLHGPGKPFVIFSNALFVGDPETSMHYFRASRDVGNRVTQHYTGIGEVMGVLELDKMFQQLGQQFRVKRSGLFTLDDARANNLIFIGSPTENLTLGEIPNTREFVFQSVETKPGNWQQAVVDLHPAPGEKGVFLPTPESQPLETDYAVIALMRGLDPSRWTLVLAGVSTVGTQAAVDYVCHEDSVKELLHRLNISNERGMKPFEAVLKVKVADDVPLEVQLLKVRSSE